MGTTGDAAGAGEVLAERGDVVVRSVAGPEAAGAALAFLDRLEAERAVPPVDEAEHRRLVALASATSDPADRWHPVAATRAGEVVGYAGVVLPSTPAGPDGTVLADLAAPRAAEVRDRVRTVLLDALERTARGHDAGRLEVWLRDADDADVAAAARQGFGLARRLGILGRPLDELPDVPAPAGVTVRAYAPDVDDAGVVGILRAAYAGTPEGGWTLERFRERRGYDWFRPDDLLVAEADDGQLSGLHWLKRRAPTVGEVYNLAIHPDAQGRGLGPVLLVAGLAHLAATGVDEVLLWVDRANAAAAGLYERHGFRTRWDDVALERVLGAGQASSVSR